MFVVCCELLQPVGCVDGIYGCLLCVVGRLFTCRLFALFWVLHLDGLIVLFCVVWFAFLLHVVWDSVCVMFCFAS